jgi:TfoX/Sxy family transcriptional regulator of competence genes
MAYDLALADRIRRRLDGTPGLVEKAMFGGIAFMVRGHMTVGVAGDELMVRVGKDRDAEALARHGARPMDFTGRPMRGWIAVAREGVEADDDLAWWIRAGLASTATLPAK